MVELLIKNGADPNATDARVKTPLHLAVSAKSIEVVKVLLQHLRLAAEVRAAERIVLALLHVLLNVTVVEDLGTPSLCILALCLNLGELSLKLAIRFYDLERL